MRCPRCNGKRCEPDNSGSLVWRACKMCHGSGIVPDNNENWFCSLPTEEKAVFMTLYTLRREAVADKTFYETVTKSANEAMELTVGTKRINLYKELLAWLKGEHKE